MNRKEINYLNTLTGLPLMLAHREILSHAQKISNQRMAGVISSYALFVKEFDEYVLLPNIHSSTELNTARVSAYNICRKAVQSLSDFGKKGIVDSLNQAFKNSVRKAAAAYVDNTLDFAERTVCSFSKEQLEEFSLWERVEHFVQANRSYKENCMVQGHNHRIRKSPELAFIRRNCTVLYRCILQMARLAANHGDAECKEFISWAESES